AVVLDRGDAPAAARGGELAGRRLVEAGGQLRIDAEGAEDIGAELPRGLGIDIGVFVADVAVLERPVGGQRQLEIALLQLDLAVDRPEVRPAEPPGRIDRRVEEIGGLLRRANRRAAWEHAGVIRRGGGQAVPDIASCELRWPDRL